MNNQSNTIKYKTYINKLIKMINLGAKNGPVGWNGLSKVQVQVRSDLLQRL